jgi:hypothetical protein
MPTAFDDLESAILRTVLYADVFHFPLSLDELHRFLISPQPYSANQIAQAMNTPALQSLICNEQGCIVRVGREHIVQTRQKHHAASQGLMSAAHQYGRWLARLPFVRMVAITGSLAMYNANEGDDVDYLLVTSVGRVWLARALSILVVRLARWQAIQLCPNYVVAENALEQKRQDLFVAHELAQMLPLHGHTLYQQMRNSNTWTQTHLPNAHTPLEITPDLSVGVGWASLKSGVEWLLNNPLGDWLENWERGRKQKRFSAQINAQSSATLDASQVKGHFNDHGRRILEQYQQRLREIGID